MAIEKIHVILCCYQGEKYISKQLDSILAQDYPLIEIHVSDDCSVDSTLSIVSEYCAKYPNISFYRNHKNLGFLKNFESSLERVSGKYFALCDQDDIWCTDKLSLSMQELQFLENSYPDKPILIHSDLELINDQDEVIESSFFTKKGLVFSETKSLALILGHCGVMGNTILMNRNLIEKALPFPVQLKYHDYWFALINECFGVRKTISKPLVKYRLHDTNTSNNKLIKTKSNTLPFMQDNRFQTIEYLLSNYDLFPEDEPIVKSFYDYLSLKQSRFSHFMFLLNNNFFKRSFFYRINAFFKIMFTKL
ncbi:glycosyltransferase family 2 protein [uncultured Cocleimonas sp.]|uniref:glycosyltransferase family 2 protein n=1 Tax=uncultured Cocleimonas sp. TaxID=1051587 RepID=UPI0026167774|nr:glycosyltransferase family 2 protein [uncultured Cocleimonas sp.]